MTENYGDAHELDKIKNIQVDQNAEDNSDIKKEFLNLRNKVTRLIDEFK